MRPCTIDETQRRATNMHDSSVKYTTEIEFTNHSRSQIFSWQHTGHVMNAACWHVVMIKRMTIDIMLSD